MTHGFLLPFLSIMIVFAATGELAAQVILMISMSVGTGDLPGERFRVGEEPSGAIVLELRDRVERSAMPVVIVK